MECILSNVISCTGVGIASLEKEIAQYIISLGKTPIAWEEALFKSDVVRECLVNDTM